MLPPNAGSSAAALANMGAGAKKRKIGARDIAPVDPWKLYMSLRSGLLAESTWALDALNIMLYDDSTVAYFHLKHFPGLLNCLLEHYLKCLRRLFDNDDLFEFASTVPTVPSKSTTTKAVAAPNRTIPNGHHHTTTTTSTSNEIYNNTDNNNNSSDKQDASASSVYVLKISYTEKEMNKLRNKQANAAQQQHVKFNDSKVIRIRKENVEIFI